MTNQNVVVPDAKSVICMALRVTMSDSSVLPTIAVPMPGRYISTHRKKLLKMLEKGGGEEGAPRINAWVDSMRASSPTRNNKLSQDFYKAEDLDSN